jgi:hypothetical protein
MKTNDRNDTGSESTATEPGVLTEVAQKVGTAVGTVVSAVSGTIKAGTAKSSTGKKGPQRTNSQPTNAQRTTKMTASNNNPSAVKTPKQRSKKKPGSAGTEHSPLKRHRIKSK